MKAVLPEAEVSGFEHRIPGITLPDPNDRHVLAAALEAGASVIVTHNLRHFPPAALAPHDLRAEAPDAFLTALHLTQPALVGAVVEAARRNLRLTTPSARDYRDALRRQGLHELVARLAPPVDDQA